MSEGDLQLRAVAFDHPDALVMIEELQDYYRSVYGDGDTTPVEPAEFAPPRGHFLVGYRGAVPVASGGWRLHTRDELGLTTGDAELKRMYVRPAHRGRGYAATVLGELERAAARAGGRRTVLETGVRQPEAIALYRRCGYRPIPNFGHYRHEPNSRCFGKVLTVPAGPVRSRAPIAS